MIPRTIHYCWFGDKEKPAEVLRMIANIIRKSKCSRVSK